MLNKLKKFFLKEKPIIYIDNESAFDEIINKLTLEKIIGIDTEFDWRNTYYPKLCLIQISTERTIFLIDPLKLSSIFKLNFILENKDIIKIFHSARSDATVLFCSSSLKIVNCFDIQVAEKFLSKDDLKGYAKIVLKYLGIKVDKSETNSNWLRRPFTRNQINYAANDVRFLIKIYKKQKKIL